MSRTRTGYTTRREFLGGSCAAALGMSYLNVGLSADAGPGEDPPATHNMLVVGEQTVFLSHLPMFGSEDPKRDDFSPHRFQVILEATFTKRGNDVKEIYAMNRRQNRATKMYTLQPERFVLQRLAATDPRRPPLTSFKASVFRDHLERVRPQPPTPIRGLED